MRDLRQSDLEVLLHAVGELYEQQDLDSFRVRAVDVLARLVPGLRHSFVEAAPREGHLVMVVDPPDSIDPDIEAAAREHLPEHPGFRMRRKIAPGRASKISDFVSRREFHRLGLYYDVYRPIGAEDLLSFEIRGASGRDHFSSLGVNRDRAGFSERDRQALDLLSPHMAQAYANAEALTLVLRARNEGGSEAIVLDERGRIAVATQRGRRLLVEYFQSGGKDELPEPLANWVRQCRARLLGHDRLARTSPPLVVARGDRRLSVRFAPPSPGGTRALLVLSERSAPSAEALRPLGLTRRQTDVLLRVAQGKTDAEIAAELVLSRRTVEKYVEQIYDRLGVRTRTAAAARAFPLLDSPPTAASS